MEITFTVLGEAEPGGSKKGFIHPHTKRVCIVDANGKLKPWQKHVKESITKALGYRPMELLTGPLELTLHFYLPRPQGHYGTGANALQVKDTAPARPIVRPDVLKLSRGVEDALTGVVYVDDAQIVDEHIHKHYGEEPRVEICVRQIEETVAQVEGQLELAAA